jgi:hypothetical protein
VSFFISLVDSEFIIEPNKLFYFLNGVSFIFRFGLKLNFMLGVVTVRRISPYTLILLV